MTDEEKRLRFHAKLTELLPNWNLYYQPPESTKLLYPCVIYELSRFHQIRADNNRYRSIPCWSATLIIKKPQDAPITHLVDGFQMCSFDRSFASDNLNHYAFTIYY